MRNTVYTLLLFFSTSLANGYDFAAEYKADVLAVVSGGLSSGADYIDNLDLKLEVDIAEVWGAGSGSIFIHGLYNNGVTFSEDRVGDFQVVSNIDAPKAWRLFEFWFEAGESNWSIRTGLYDLNSEFDANEIGAVFLNSSHGIGPDFGQTGLNGPSIFPISSLSLRVAKKFESMSVRVAVLDAVPGDPTDSSSNEIDLSREDGALTLAEIDVSYADSARLWAGYWRYSAEHEYINGSGSRRGNDGWYVGSEAEFRLGSRAAGWFARFGQADHRFNVLSSYLGLGAVIVGPIAARPTDRFGVAVASARAGDSYRDYLRRIGEGAGRRETTWELTYQVIVNEHLLIQPDIQYIRNPSVSTILDDAWVVGCRFQLNY